MNNYERKFKIRFLIIFCLIGIINILLIARIYTYEAKEALTTRALSQMASVNSLYETKFKEIHKKRLKNIDVDHLLHLRSGMGASGEVYLVDSDFKIKSASRFGFSVGSSIMKNESTVNAFKNMKGTAVVKDYRGVEVVSAYAPVMYNNQIHALLSEIDLEEVLKPLEETRRKIIVVAVVLIIITLILSFLFSSKMIRMLRSMKNQIDKLNQKSSQLIIEVQESEREKISHDIHDGIGQVLTALKWRLGMAENKDGVVEMLALCDQALNEARTISQNVIPSILKDFGFFFSIQELTKPFQTVDGPKIHLSVTEEAKEVDFNPTFEVNLYRIFQELIQNAIKHSKADSIQFDFQLTDSQFMIKYADNGIGCKPERFPPRTLDYRVRLFGGSIEKLDSVKGLSLQIKFSLTELINENIHS
jgi:signal transduction histidine kinase